MKDLLKQIEDNQSNIQKTIESKMNEYRQIYKGENNGDLYNKLKKFKKSEDKDKILFKVFMTYMINDDMFKKSDFFSYLLRIDRKKKLEKLNDY